MRALALFILIGCGVIGCSSTHSPLATETAEDARWANLDLKIILTQDGAPTVAAAKMASTLEGVEMWIYGLSEPSNYAGNLPENVIAHEEFQIENGQVSGSVKITPGLTRIDLVVKDADGKIHWFATQEFQAELGENLVNLEVYPLAITGLTFSPDIDTALRPEDQLEVEWSASTIPLFTLFKMDYGIGDSVESAEWSTLQTASPQVQLPPIEEGDKGHTFVRVWTNIPYGDGPKTDPQGPSILSDAELVFTINIPG